MQRIHLFCLFLLCGLVSTELKAQGSLNALGLDGTQQISSKTVNHAIHNGDFTFELWVKPATATGTQAVVANGLASPALYTRTGGQLNSGKIGFLWHGTWFNTAAVAEAGKWQHIAMVRESGIISIYVNGVADGNVFSDATRMNSAAISLGAAGNGKDFFNGAMDEVRIWKVARSVDQIRASMCNRMGLTGALKAYWRFDEGGGSTTADYSGNQYSLSGLTSANRVVSGAPIGNVSAVNFDTQNINKAVTITSMQGNFTLQSVGNPTGICIYRVDSLPNFISNIQGIGNTRTYFGVFTVGGTSNSYTAFYKYGGYADAVAESSNIKLFQRADNEAPSWSVATTTTDPANNQIIQTGAFRTEEIILAGFTNPTPPPPCLPPSNLIVEEVKQFSARINWMAGNSGNYKIEYGLKGFVPGTGSVVGNTSQRPYTVSGLQSNTEYDFYVSSLCDEVTGNKSDSVMISFKTAVDFSAIGPGNAGNFANSAGYASIPALNLNTNTLSITAWIKPSKLQSGLAGIVFCNDSSTRSGLVLKAGNELGYVWNGSSETANYSSKLIAKAGEWSHVALIVSSEGSKLCLNGNCVFQSVINGFEAFDAATHFGNIPNEQADFEGQIDELRIWTYGLSDEEIRNGMCQKLKDYSADLLGYWSFDQLPGDTVLIERSGNSQNAALQGLNNANFFLSSGAPIGDSSVNSYALKATSSLTDTNARGDVFTVENLKGTVSGVHIYRTAGMLNHTEGLIAVPGNDTHYGVFIVGDGKTAYDASLQYADAFQATDDALFTLYTRFGPVAKVWAQNESLIQDTVENRLLLPGNAQNREFVIGLLKSDSTACAVPTGLGIGSRTLNSAKIGWITGGADRWNIEYGLKGFVLGEGLRLKNQEEDSLLFTNLDGKLVYEFYVQDTCSGSGASAWSGPAEFSAILCEAPDGIRIARVDSTVVQISWNKGAFSKWNFEYGPAGFQAGTGSKLEVTELPLVLDQIDRFGRFDFYLSTACVDGSSSAVSDKYSFVMDKLPIACIPPADVVFTKVDSSSGTLNWTKGPFRKWKVEIGIKGFTPGTGTDTVITELPFTLSGLAPTAYYDVYVYSFCNDSSTSVFTGPLTFVLDTTVQSVSNLSGADFSIYPNPTAAKLTIAGKLAKVDVLHIQVLDLQGRVVFAADQTVAIDFSRELDLSSLNKGMYLLKISNDQEQYLQKILLQE